MAHIFESYNVTLHDYYLSTISGVVSDEQIQVITGIPESIYSSIRKTLSHETGDTIPGSCKAYQTQLPDKNILQQKWKEIFEETNILKQS